MSQQINLFNPRFRKEKRYLTAPALAIAVGVALAGSVAVAVTATGRVAALEDEAAALAVELKEAEARKATVLAGLVPRQKDAAVERDVASAEREQRALRGVTEILEQNRVGDPRGYSAYFQALARARVNGLWLTGIDIGGANADVGLSGRALRAELLPGYLNGLAREPALRGKAFERVEIARPDAEEGRPGRPASAATKEPPAEGTGAAPAPPPWVEFTLQARAGVAP
ncbi:MSHA biogenesis protein MshA [Massilia sp. METH4]|uniref:MSHA biogenesis protein MshA n=1 Tax=Massilia sp. METH4 TaxID=3123041 RepID=UPI0030CC699D